MPAHKKPRYSTEDELKAAVVAACLREIDAMIAREVPEEKPRRIGWTVEESRYLCEGKYDPEEVEQLEKKLEERRQAAALFLRVREAIVDFEAWARTIEGRPEAQRWPYYAVFQTLVPALVPLVREPYNHGHILSEHMADSWRIESQPPWKMSPRERLIFTLDHPLLPGTTSHFNAIGLHRPSTDRELALYLLSAGHFPSLDLTTDTVASVINRERKTVAKKRREIWLQQTGGRNVGPNRLREADNDASPDSDKDDEEAPDEGEGNTEAEP